MSSSMNFFNRREMDAVEFDLSLSLSLSCILWFQ